MIRILIADDQALVRGALAALLNLEDDFDVVASVGTGLEAVETIRRRSDIDVVLMDVEMPELNGLNACQEIIRLRPNTRVLMVTTFGRPGYVRRAFDAGALGFVVKDAPSEQLAQHVRAIMSGRRVLDPQLAVDTLTMGNNPLTEREIDVLREIEKGGSIDDIAREICLSPGTVRNHISAVLGKTGTRNRAEAALRARENGWL
ncbi:MAG: response regulator transcription factor [Actinomycetaceae bacterium]|nr:response regulator transcription factor [Actinomycetaceae bacterium]